MGTARMCPSRGTLDTVRSVSRSAAVQKPGRDSSLWLNAEPPGTVPSGDTGVVV